MTDPNQSFTDGKAYERMMGRWSRLVGSQFLDWLDIPHEQNWLDVGCGNGAFTAEILSRASPLAVTGIDPSPDQLSHARARHSGANVRFQAGDAQALPFGDGQFDVAAMALVISFVPEPLKAIAEMVRVVRPGGWVATYMWDIPGGGLPVQPVYSALRSMGLSPPLPPNAAVSSQAALRQLWQAAGLVSLEAKVIRIPVSYSSFEDFWDSNSVPIGPQGKFMQSLSPAALMELRQLLQRQLSVEAGGSITYEGFSNAIVGRVAA